MNRWAKLLWDISSSQDRRCACRAMSSWRAYHPLSMPFRLSLRRCYLHRHTCSRGKSYSPLIRFKLPWYPLPSMKSLLRKAIFEPKQLYAVPASGLEYGIVKVQQTLETIIRFGQIVIPGISDDDVIGIGHVLLPSPSTIHRIGARWKHPQGLSIHTWPPSRPMLWQVSCDSCIGGSRNEGGVKMTIIWKSFQHTLCFAITHLRHHNDLIISAVVLSQQQWQMLVQLLCIVMCRNEDGERRKGLARRLFVVFTFLSCFLINPCNGKKVK